MTGKQQEFNGLGISAGIGIGVVHVHELTTGKRLLTRKQSHWPAWSPDGRLLATLTRTYATYRDPQIRQQVRLWAVG